MEDIIEAFYNINNVKNIFLVCGVFISFDVLTGYLKAFKFKKVNSSISRDGYIKKVGWILAIVLGYLVKVLVNVDLFLYMTSIVCVATEGISVYENLGEIGIDLKFKKYFEKLKDKEE